ncbi:MAG: helix-turn-helix domain-containing protein [Candidatus Micrarchaeota archaeon]|nr:helix-turn-helix domain-containing protein [Candidatus Micrarchaeota archaeon]
MEPLKVKIAGEIALSEDPGAAMKKWREVFSISQTDLAQHLKITPSTISDYEGNRRKSPGIHVVKRFIDALFDLDNTNGGKIASQFKQADETSEYYQVFNFPREVSGKELAKVLEAKVIAAEGKLANKAVFGCTILDSLKVILELPYESFVKVYSNTSQRALLFTRVETGRSPLVAVRVTPIKPAIIILHSVDEVDKLAIKIAESEGIPLLVTKLKIEDVKARLAQLGA